MHLLQPQLRNEPDAAVVIFDAAVVNFDAPVVFLVVNMVAAVDFIDVFADAAVDVSGWVEV